MRLGVPELAALFGVAEDTVQRWVEDEALPVAGASGQLRFNPTDVLEWATARGRRVPQGLMRAADPLAAAAEPGAAEALERGGVHSGVPGVDGRHAVAALLERVALPAGTDRRALLALLLAREDLGSTAIGDGIALPHVRTPIVLRLREPLLALGYLEAPLAVAGPDGRPVDKLFLAITPSTKSHLQLLAGLGYLLQDGGVRSALAQRCGLAKLAHAMRAAEQLRSSAPPGGAPR